jgi:hypothetical protein
MATIKSTMKPLFIINRAIEIISARLEPLNFVLAWCYFVERRAAAQACRPP